MNEADLDSLLGQGARRLRAIDALRWALAVLGLTALAVAASVFIWRMAFEVPASEMQSVQVSQAFWSILPFVLAGITFAAAFFFTRANPTRVAAEIDSRANLQDHLLTWIQLRAQTFQGEQAEFRAAQSRSTLLLAKGLSVKALIPVRFPDWTPALWMALIGLCCALLVPPQIEAETGASAREREQNRRKSASVIVAPNSGDPSAAASPRVQPLSPTELLKLQLRATDPNLSTEQRKQLLADTLQKIGGIPENELTDEVRELLRELRGNTQIAITPDPKQSGGSAQLAAKNGEPTRVSNAEAANAVNFSQRGLALAQREFLDVKNELDRYYRGGKEQ